MRVQSPLLQHIQAPPTIFGMAPLHFAVVAVVTLLSLGIFRLLFSNAAAFASVLIILPSGCLYALKIRRKEPHCETLHLLPLVFFWGKKKRILLAGAPLFDSKGRGKK